MMPMEQQVACLELSKQLKDAGYPQDNSLWYWEEIFDYDEFRITLRTRKSSFSVHAYAAPTPTELGEVLPTSIEKGNFFYLTIRKLENNTFGVGYMFEEGWYCHTDAPTLADAMGEMWLYLKAEGLIDD